MQLSAALKRVGVVITEEIDGGDTTTLFLRVDMQHNEKWIRTVEGFVLGSEGKPFQADVSRKYEKIDGALKWRWRVVFQGDRSAGLVFLGVCALEAATSFVKELDSIPLVGRAKYAFDPSRGRIKGAHDLEIAPSVLSAAIGGGSSS